MRNFVSMLFIVLIVLIWSHECFAGTDVTVDLEKLPSTTQTAILKAMEKESESNNLLGVPSDPEALGQYAALGTQIAKAIGAACKELSLEVNDFITTPVGKLTAFLIVWKVIGKEVLRFVVMTLLWFIITPILLTSFVHFHTRKQVKEEGEKIKYIERYEFDNEDAKTASAIVHVCIFIALTLFCVLMAVL